MSYLQIASSSSWSWLSLCLVTVLLQSNIGRHSNNVHSVDCPLAPFTPTSCTFWLINQKLIDHHQTEQTASSPPHWHPLVGLYYSCTQSASPSSSNSSPRVHKDDNNDINQVMNEDDATEYYVSQSSIHLIYSCQSSLFSLLFLHGCCDDSPSSAVSL